MPSIPVYGFDELEPSMLNTAKRRVIGLMDMSQEQLTERPETDPTNGKQTTFVEQLTEEVYSAIKDIEILDSYISESSGVDLKDLRSELKKGASQIAVVNNALRKITSAYDKLRPNMIYTDLKIFIGFVNSIRILKKTALRFFEIVDDLIDNTRKTQGATYTKPVINDDDEVIEEEEEPSSEIVPPPLSTPTPNVPIPLTTAPPPPPVFPVPPPPPPRQPYKGNFGKRMKAYQALITKLLRDNNITDQNDADLLLDYANDYVKNTGAFLKEQELQDYITNRILNPPQLTGYTNQELQDFFVVAGKKAYDANFTPDENKKLQTQISNFLIGNKNTALPDDQELDNMIFDIMNDRGSSSSSNQPPIVIGVPQPTQGTQGVPIGITGVPSNPLTGTPIPQDYADLRVRADVLKGDKDLTNQIGRNALIRTEGVIDEAIAKNKDFKATLNKYRKLIEYGEEPFLTYTTPLPPITKQEKATLNGLATDYKQEKKKLTMKDRDKWRDAYKAFMVANKISFTPSP